MEFPPGTSWCSLIPEDFLLQITNTDQQLSDAIDKTIEAGCALQAVSTQASRPNNAASISLEETPPAAGLQRFIYDGNFADSLPGTLCLEEGGNPQLPNNEINVLHERMRQVYQYFKRVFNYALLDGKGNQLHVTLNYREEYMNAHWNGTQVILGSGSDKGVSKFPLAADVLTHELTHGIIACTSQLALQNESGALTEHLADTFGILFKQYKDRSPADKSCWTFGNDLFRIHGRQDVRPELTAPHGWIIPLGENTGYIVADAKQHSSHWFPPYLRDFANPASIYPAPPQPCHYSQYKDFGPKVDHGGVHHNAGIPNHAFYHAACEAGRNPWEGVGQVWFRAITDPELGADCTFARFAAKTIDIAMTSFPRLVGSISNAWKKVGVQAKL